MLFTRELARRLPRAGGGVDAFAFHPGFVASGFGGDGAFMTAAKRLAVSTEDGAEPLIRLAGWKAGRYGLTGELVHPPTGTSRPAADVVADLLEHVGDALRDAGDHDLVSAGLARLLADGTGARRQRELLEAAQDEESRAQAVVALARITAGE